ncbi:unnamed protein product [Trichogramma brassicae]|uniref:Uncharacterized protein n=1 Tax=Trichogramma brassicae TaxID=86971 RepID=A0A6H5J3Z0_9HYME|nr:unnamed protein product [Trichogramma brassicae]
MRRIHSRPEYGVPAALAANRRFLADLHIPPLDVAALVLYLLDRSKTNYFETLFLYVNDVSWKQQNYIHLKLLLFSVSSFKNPRISMYMHPLSCEGSHTNRREGYTRCECEGEKEESEPSCGREARRPLQQRVERRRHGCEKLAERSEVCWTRHGAMRLLRARRRCTRAASNISFIPSAIDRRVRERRARRFARDLLLFDVNDNRRAAAETVTSTLSFACSKARASSELIGQRFFFVFSSFHSSARRHMPGTSSSGFPAFFVAENYPGEAARRRQSKVARVSNGTSLVIGLAGAVHSSAQQKIRRAKRATIDKRTKCQPPLQKERVTRRPTASQVEARKEHFKCFNCGWKGHEASTAEVPVK